MSDAAEFFLRLFQADHWPPRWLCGQWSDFHGWLYICSDIAIWLAYFVIPVILIYFVQRRPNVPFLPVFWLFGAFIVLCGSTHLLDAVMFWWPGYRLGALVRFLTALVSMITVFALIRNLPRALTLAAGQPLAIHHEIRERDQRIAALEAQLAALRRADE